MWHCHIGNRQIKMKYLEITLLKGDEIGWILINTEQYHDALISESHIQGISSILCFTKFNLVFFPYMLLALKKDELK